MSWLRGRRIYFLLYICGLLAFSAVAGNRLLHQSPDPHFVYQADAWLHGQLAIDPRPEKGDDWAILEVAELDDGSIVHGRRLSTRPEFMLAGGEEIPVKRVRKRLGQIYYVSFPPAPVLLMLPSALIAGRAGNDVLPTILLAALVIPLAFLTLTRLRQAGLSERTQSENIWLALAFAFGSVFFFSAVQGRVWFTAHIAASVLCWGYLASSVEARNPWIAGICLGLGALSRVPLAFLFPVFAFEAWRASGGDRRTLLLSCARFALPIVVLAAAAAAYNIARWDSATEFGHRFLHVRQQAQIESFGLFSPHYLWRNIQAALMLLPELSTSAPFIRISGHGLAIWLTSPFILWAIWPRTRSRLHVSLWIAITLILLPTLFYQNTGWVQFGYRFALDYLPLLVVLVAIGGLSLGRWARAAIVIAIAINLFGATTFARRHQHYRTDAASYGALDPN